jgi:predicted ATPase
MPTNAFQFRYTQLLGQLALGMSLMGDSATALARVDEALRHSERTGERWCLAELWRIRGEIALRQGGAAANDYAQAQYRNAIDLARTQGALSWELRAATSLARLQHSQGRAGEARDTLTPVLGRFAEGHAEQPASRDLVGATTLLEELRR